MTDLRNAPIGVFDSGLGGLTAVRELRRILPDENIVYFGDTGRVPYGTRGTEVIIQYAKQDIAFLLQQGVKLMIAACGTISSTLPAQVSQSLPVPYMGVVQSAAKAAAAASRSGKIGVIGTPATIKSGSYEAALRALRRDVQITAVACPLFVPLVENGYFNRGNPVTTLVARDYLRAVKQSGADTLILGCTHYPLIADIIADELGGGVTLIDPGREAAVTAEQLLRQRNMLRQDKGGEARYFVSDSTESFARLSSSFLGEYAGGSVTQTSVDGCVLRV